MDPLYPTPKAESVLNAKTNKVSEAANTKDSKAALLNSISVEQAAPEVNDYFYTPENPPIQVQQPVEPAVPLFEANPELAGQAIADGEEFQSNSIENDFRTLSPSEFIGKHGIKGYAEYKRTFTNNDAFNGGITKATADGFSRVEKQGSEDVRDLAVDAIGSLVNIGASLPAIPFAGIDNFMQELDVDFRITPSYSKATKLISDGFKALQSDDAAKNDEIYALRQQVSSYNLDKEFEDRIANGEDTNWDTVAKEFNRFKDTMSNLGSSGQVGGIVAQGLGTASGIGAAVRFGSKKLAAESLAKQGVVAANINQQLATKAGQELIQRKARMLVPVMTGITEGGGAFSDTQLSILAMTEEEALQNPQYKAMRDKGASHESALTELSIEAGTTAAIITAWTAGGISKLNTNFAINPLGGASRGGITEVLKDTAKEGVEETLQNTAGQLGKNIGKDSVGFETDLTEGFGSSAAEGLVGGVGTGGAMGVTGLARERVREAGAQVSASREGSLDNNEEYVNAIREGGLVDINPAKVVNDETDAKASPTVNQSFKEYLDSNPGDYKTQAVSYLEEQANRALLVSPEETARLARYGIEDTGNGVTRANAIKVLGNTFNNTSNKAEKILTAVLGVQNADLIRSLDNGDVSEAAKSLGEEGSAYTGAIGFSKQVSKNPDVIAMETFLSEITPAEISDVLKVEFQENNSETVEAILGTIAARNPEVLKTLDQNILNQVSGKRLSAIIEGSKELGDLFGKFQAVKDDPNLAATQQGGKGSSNDAVSRQIETGMGSDQFKGLVDHNADTIRAIKAGNREAALNNIGQTDNFRTSNQNKLAAYTAARNEFAETGKIAKPISYQAWSRKAKQFVSAETIQFDNPTIAGLDSLISKIEKDNANIDTVVNVHEKIFNKAFSRSNNDARALRNAVKKDLDLAQEDVKGLEETAKTSEAKLKKKTEDSLVGYIASKGGIADVENNGTAAIKKAVGKNASNVVGVFGKDGKGISITQMFEENFKGNAKWKAQGINSVKDLIDAIGKASKANQEDVRKATFREGSIAQAEQDKLVSAEIERNKKQKAIDAVKQASKQEQAPVAQPVVREQVKEETKPQEWLKNWSSNIYEFSKLGKVWSIKAQWTNIGVNGILENIKNGLLPNGQKAAENYSSEEIKSLNQIKDLSDKIIGNVSKGMNDFASRTAEVDATTKEKKTYKQLFEEGKLTSKNIEAKTAIFGFAAKDTTNGLALDERFGFAATVALVSVLGKIASTKQVKDILFQDEKGDYPILAKHGYSKEDVEAIIGKGQDNLKAFTEAFESLEGNGNGQFEILDEVTSAIKSVLEVSENGNVKKDVIENTSRILALETIQAAIDLGILARSMVNINTDGNNVVVTKGKTLPSGKNILTLSIAGVSEITAELAVEDLVGSLGLNGNKLLGMFGREQALLIGEPAKSVTGTIKNKGSAEVSRETKTAIRRMNETPSYLNVPFLVHMRSLFETEANQSRFAKSIGIDVEATTDNAVAAVVDASQSKLASMKRAWQFVNRVADGIDKFAKDNGKAVEEVPYYNEAYSIVNERYMWKAGVNQQSDKLMRELVPYTVSEIDLSNEQHKRMLVLAFGQAMDLGSTKLEVNSAENVIRTVAELLHPVSGDKAYRNIIDVLKDGLKSGKTDADAYFNAVEASGLEFTNKLHNALFEVARMEVAIENGETKFKTGLSVEVDGKTDGIINALVLTMTGNMSARRIGNFARGGLIFGKKTNQAESLNTFYAKEFATGTVSKLGEDMYTKVAAAGTVIVRKMINDMDATQKAKATGFLTRMAKLSGDVKVENDNISFSRNFAKYPTTMIVYGSSLGGIANRIYKEFVDSFYEKLTAELKKGSNQPLSEIEGFRREDLVGILEGKAYDAMVADPFNFRFTVLNNGNLFENITEYLATPINTAITEQTENLEGVLKDMRLTQQYQDAMARKLFDLQVQKLQKEGKSVWDMTKNEYDAFMFKAAQVGAIVNTNGKVYHYYKTKNSKKDELQFAVKSIKENLTSSANAREFDDVGVSSTAITIQGNGDANTIRAIWVDPSIDVKGIAQNFDGIDMSILSAIEKAEGLNRGVGDNWRANNIFAQFADSLKQSFIQSRSIFKEFGQDVVQRVGDQVNPAHYGLLSRKVTKANATLADKVYNTLFSNAQLFVDYGLLNNVNEFTVGKFNKNPLLWFTKLMEIKALEHKLLLDAMEEHSYGIDHLAGLEGVARYGKGKFEFDSLDFDGIANSINQEVARQRAVAINFYKERNNIKVSEREANTDKVNKKAFGAIKRALKDAEFLTGKKLAFTLKDAGVSKGLIDLLFAAEKFGSNPDKSVFKAKVYFANGNAMDVYNKLIADGVGLPYIDSIQEGVYFKEQNIIIVNNETAETVIHELLHSAVDEAITTYYKNPESAPAQLKLAIKGLEENMADFLRLDIPASVVGQQDAADLFNTQNVIRDLQGDTARMMEFISWTLTNPSLESTLKDVRTYSTFNRIKTEATKMVKRLFTIFVKGSKYDVDINNLFDSIRFNTLSLVVNETQYNELMAAKAKARAAARNKDDAIETEITHLNQVTTNDPKKSVVERAIKKFLADRAIKAQNRKIADSIFDGTVLLENIKISQEALDIVKEQAIVDEALQKALQAGFTMDARSQLLFKNLYTLIAFGSKDQEVNRILTNVYTQFMDKKVLDSFKKHTSEGVAASMTEFLVNSQEGLALVFALSQTNDTVRSVINGMSLPDNRVDNSTFDGKVSNAITTVMDYAADLSNRVNVSKDVLKSLDNIVEAMNQNETEQKAIVALAVSAGKVYEDVGGLIDRTDNKISNKREEVATGIAENESIPFIIRAIAIPFSDKVSSKVADAIEASFNKMEGWNAIGALFQDIRSANKTKKQLNRMQQKATKLIDQGRQRFLEDMPEAINGLFKRELTRLENIALIKAVKLDISTIPLTSTLAILKGEKTTEELRAGIEKNMGAVALRKMQGHMEELARVLGTDTDPQSASFLRNAYAISNQFGYPEMEGYVDAWVSLKAMDYVDANIKETLKDLFTNEIDGVSGALNFVTASKIVEDRHLQEYDEATQKKAKQNGWKGHFPEATGRNQSIVIQSKSEKARLEALGYTMGEKYKGNPNHRMTGDLYYFHSNIAQKNRYTKGVAQTVHGSYRGVSIKFGYSTDMRVNRIITQENGLQELIDYANQNKGKHNIAGFVHPEFIFDGNGKIIAAELPIGREAFRAIEKDQNFGEGVGVWLGRTYEERVSRRINDELIEWLYQEWNTATPEERKEFVDIGNKNQKDKVYADSWKVLGAEFHHKVSKKFGEKDFFPVKKSHINDAIGYREAGVSDAWTDVTRNNDKVNEIIKISATAIFGKKGYTALMKTENVVSDVVSFAKTSIVGLAVQVVFGNLLSNTIHLMSYGINPIEAAKLQYQAALELREYTKIQKRINLLAIDAQTARIKGGDAQARVENQLKALSDRIKNMRIYPLIEAGHFSAIAEDIVTADGDTGNMIHNGLIKLANMVPSDKGKVVASNLLFTKESIAFKTMVGMTQYGDFMAKYALMTKLQKKGVSKEETMDILMEEFVNYQNVSGRDRQLLEKYGLLWFMNYKLRILKVARKAVMERPLRAAMLMSTHNAFGVDTVLDSNIGTKVIDGSIGGSVGLGMAVQGVNLHPTLGIVNDTLNPLS